MLNYALGTLGMERETFNRITWGDYLRKCYGYERAQQVGYEQARWLAYWMVKSSMSKTDSIQKVTDLVTFPWERDEIKEAKPLSKDEIEAIRKKLEGNGISTDNSGNECAHQRTDTGAAAGT